MTNQHNPATGNDFSVQAWIQRALSEFIQGTLYPFVGLFLLSLSILYLDHTRPDWLEPAHSFITRSFFVNPTATASFVRMVTGGLMTVISITISMMLIALQQSTGKLGIQAVNYFVNRRRNQVLLGYYVGLLLYALILSAATSDDFNPVYGATGLLLLTVAALFSLIVLLYMVVNQMRPIVMMDSAADKALSSRIGQASLLERTRREAWHDRAYSHPVHADKNGYFTWLDLEPLEKALGSNRENVEIVIAKPIGDYFAFGEVIAYISAEDDTPAPEIVEATCKAIQLGPKRNERNDPAYNLEHFEMIAWSSISTAQSNPEIGLLALHSLRDVLARWLAAKPPVKNRGVPLPVVYHDDVWERALDVHEALALISSKSVQYQVYAAVLRSLMILHPQMTPDLQERVADLICRTIPTLTSHFLSRELDKQICMTIESLRQWEHAAAADALQEAYDTKLEEIGQISPSSSN